MSFIPDGRRLREVREQQEYSIELLAEAAGVGEKTIRNLESGRTRSARLPTLKALCAVLDIDVSDIARPKEPPRRPGAPSTDGLPRPSRLEELVDWELASDRPPPIATAGGPVQMLTPKRFQDIMTAFRLHAGRRFWLPALVLRQRGISEAEARLLDTECGVGARFLIGQRPELGGGEALHLTAYAARAEHTILLQERLESHSEVPLFLRVLVAREPPGFALFGSHTMHPWTLLVDGILGPS